MVHRSAGALPLDGGKSANAEEYETGKCRIHRPWRNAPRMPKELLSSTSRPSIWRDNVGNIYTGIISGVTEWGMYVEIIENKCEGNDPVAGYYR
jgi:ribonuclease R